MNRREEPPQLAAVRLYQFNYEPDKCDGCLSTPENLSAKLNNLKH